MMGLRTAQDHKAFACHETFYENEVRKGTNLLVIENVTEYKLETVQSRLGRTTCASMLASIHGCLATAQLGPEGTS